jgi:hypothetical protein
MRITKLLLICICSVVFVPAVWGQAASAPATQGILGYLDPQTGAFRPVPSAAEESPDLAAASTTFTGTITVTLTITLKTTALTNITCSEEVSVLDGATTGAARFFGESNSVAATGTGITRTCKLSIPYSWGLTTQASDSMTTGYAVVGVTGTTLPQRTSTHSPLDTRKVPANGAITALTAAVTL